MPHFLLQITAQLKNIAQLEPNNGVDDREMSYFFTLMCENCGEISKEVCTHASTWDNHNGEYANLVLECQGCERIGTVNLILGYGAPLTQELANALEYVPLMMFRCDGLIPYSYVFNGGWKVTLNSRAKIRDCNLLGGNWDYNSLGGNFISDDESDEGDEDGEEEEEEKDEEDGEEEEEENEEDGEEEEEHGSPGGPSGPSVLNAQSRFIQYWE